MSLFRDLSSVAHGSDSWSLVRAEANGNGFPPLLLNRYLRGVLYV